MTFTAPCPRCDAPEALACRRARLARLRADNHTDVPCGCGCHQVTFPRAVSRRALKLAARVTPEIHSASMVTVAMEIDKVLDAVRRPLLAALKGLDLQAPGKDDICHSGLVPVEACGRCSRVQAALDAIANAEADR